MPRIGTTRTAKTRAISAIRDISTSGQHKLRRRGSKCYSCKKVFFTSLDLAERLNTLCSSDQVDMKIVLENTIRVNVTGHKVHEKLYRCRMDVYVSGRQTHSYDRNICVECLNQFVENAELAQTTKVCHWCLSPVKPGTECRINEEEQRFCNAKCVDLYREKVNRYDGFLAHCPKCRSYWEPCEGLRLATKRPVSEWSCRQCWSYILAAFDAPEYYNLLDHESWARSEANNSTEPEVMNEDEAVETKEEIKETVRRGFFGSLWQRATSWFART